MPVIFLFFLQSRVSPFGFSVYTSVADPDPTFFHPGSRIRTVSIPDPGSSSKNLSILNPQKAKKWFLSSKKYDPGCSSRIPDPDADFLPSRIQGSKRYPIPDPGSGSATLQKTIQKTYQKTIQKTNQKTIKKTKK
jgi:hypothetical protein